MEQEILARGASIYTAKLRPGDTVYIPTGALHGGLNTHHGTVALTGNFLDTEHAGDVIRYHCVEGNENSALCGRLMRDFSGVFDGVASGVAAERARGGSYNFWDWVLLQEGYCTKVSASAASKECPDAVRRCNSEM